MRSLTRSSRRWTIRMDFRRGHECTLGDGLLPRRRGGRWLRVACDRLRPCEPNRPPFMACEIRLEGGRVLYRPAGNRALPGDRSRRPRGNGSVDRCGCRCRCAGQRQDDAATLGVSGQQAPALQAPARGGRRPEYSYSNRISTCAKVFMSARRLRTWPWPLHSAIILTRCSIMAATLISLIRGQPG